MAVQTLSAGGSLRLPMTYDDYLALGETKHHEYYDGLLVVNPPSRRHVVVQTRLSRQLADAAPPGVEVLPEWGWQAGPQTVFEPDVMAFSATAPGEDLLREPPLIVVEVGSPSTRSEDWGRKREAYALGGAQWYWLVDLSTERLIVLRNTYGSFTEVTTHEAGGHLELTEPFPVSLDLTALFAA